MPGGVETVVGAAMLIAASFLLQRRRSLARHESATQKNPARRSPALMGAGISVAELPTAFPYFRGNAESCVRFGSKGKYNQHAVLWHPRRRGGDMTVAPPPPRRTTRSGGDPGAIAAGLGAVLLFISLFLHWYAPGLSAWTVFEVWDLVLAGLALWTVVMAAGRLGLGERRPDSWLLVASIAAVVVVIAALINHPPAAIGHSPEDGSWLALAASILMVTGAALSVARITVAVELEGGGPPPARRWPGGRARAHPTAEATDTTRVIASDPEAPPPSAGR